MEVARGDIVWGNLPGGHERRPALVVTRTSIAHQRNRVTVAPITTIAKGIKSEVALGKPEGLRRKSVANCGELLTLYKAFLDPAPIGHLGQGKLLQLNNALRNALGIDT